MKPYQDGKHPAMRRFAVSTSKLLVLAVLGVGVLALIPVNRTVTASTPAIDNAAPIRVFDKKKKKQQTTRRGSWDDDSGSGTTNPGR